MSYWLNAQKPLLKERLRSGPKPELSYGQGFGSYVAQTTWAFNIGNSGSTADQSSPVQNLLILGTLMI